MAAGTTEVADVVVPAVFTPYVQQLTEEKSRLLRAGVMVRDAEIDGLLAGGGLTFEVPSFKDLDNDDDNVSSDTGSAASTKKIGTSKEVAVRLSRNQHWSSADLASDLAGKDPMQAVANRVGGYWDRRAQRAVVATLSGIFLDNAAAPSGTEHVQDDLTVDVSGGGYVAGATDFSAEAMIDAATTMGDSADQLRALFVHSVVYSRMQKNNLIDFIPDSDGKVTIPTFLGRIVIVDDGLPNPAGAGAAATATGIYHSWLLGEGALRWGVATPKKATAVDRDELANNGGGEEVLTSRVTWCFHGVGHKWAGTAPNGGPANGTSANMLAHAGSWQRVFPERKQIKIARLITREA